MKYVYSFLFLLGSFTISAQFSLQTGYSLGIPQGKMAQNIKPVHSLMVGGLYTFNGKLNRIKAGIDMGWGMYANSRKMQTFNFPNGSSTDTWVSYSSNVTQVSLVSRVSMFQKKKINPYLSAKVGYYNFYSSIYVEDPHDPLGCRALVQKNLINDNSIATSLGGGVEVNWSLFGRHENKDLFIDLGVNRVRGGRLDYINTKKLVDASNPPPPTQDTKALNVTFINASTQELHDHQVAEVYTSPLSLLEFRLSARFVLR